jgi:hypothetical protein
MYMSAGGRVTQQGAPAHVTRKSAANEAVIPRGYRGFVENPPLPHQVPVPRTLKKGKFSLKTDQSNVQQ